MIVSVNGSPVELREGANVVDAVTTVRNDSSRRGVAVAVNGAVVPRGLWEDTVLGEGDRVEILAAVAGG